MPAGPGGPSSPARSMDAARTLSPAESTESAESAGDPDVAGVAEVAPPARAPAPPAGGPASVGAPSLPADRPPADEASSDARYQMRLGERLRAIRRARGLRLQDVEIDSDGRFKAVVVGSYERGDRAVAAHRLASLAEFYGVPLTDVLPDEVAAESEGREDGIRLSVERLRAAEDDTDTAPLLRLVRHVQWLRGDYNGRVLSLRGDDLRTVAIALDVQPDALGAWLEERGLLVS